MQHDNPPITRQPAYEKRNKRGEDDAAFLHHMRETVAEGAGWWRENWDLARKDLQFAYGDQWPQSLKNDTEVSRLMLTLNMLPQIIHQVTGNAKKSSFGIQVSQNGGAELPPLPVKGGQKLLSLSEIMEGLIRDIEYRSNTVFAYMHALQHAVESGFGWLRIVTEQDPNNPFNVDLKIEHVLDRFSVILDPFSGKHDFSDAGWGAVQTVIPRKVFRQMYPKVAAGGGGDMLSWGHMDYEGTRTFWEPLDGVRICEFFWKEPMKRTAINTLWPDGQEQGYWLDEVDEVIDELMAGGVEITGEKTADTHKVKWVKCTSHNILERANWLGMDIPLIPVFGREIHRQRTREFAGVVRWSHDPQIMRNHWFSSATERMTMIPHSPYVATAEQLAGYEDEWTVQGAQLKMVLPYNNDPEAPGPPARQHPPPMPVGELSMVDIATKAVHDSSGIHQTYIGAKSNETSGRAIMARQAEGDTGSYDFLWGLTKGLTTLGQQLVNIIPRFYTGKRAAHIVLPDQSGVVVPINFPIIDEESGVTVHLAPLGLGRYTCQVEVGAGYLNNQKEFLDFVLQWQQSDPQGFQLIKHKVVQALNIPEKSEIARILMTTVPPEILSPEEREMLPEREPDPMQMAMAQVEQAKVEAEMAKAQSASQVAELKVAVEQLKLQQEQIEASQAGAGGDDDARLKALIAQTIQEMRGG